MTETPKLVARAEAWEDDEMIITVNGHLVGCTLSKGSAAAVARWLNESMPELLAVINVERRP